MSLLIFLLALVWIVADFAALIFFYFYTGFWATVALIVGSAFLGGLLFKWQMGGVWRQFKDRLSQAAVPGVEAADGLLLFTATCLMIAPLPLMDLTGLLLMIPPVRRFIARRIRGWVAKRFEPGSTGFVFQMGGIPARGWPAPEYTDPLDAHGGGSPVAMIPSGSEPPASLADDAGEEIEEGEFRSVPSKD
ncbi:MAG TPA: FxsA family protein [Planctomycetota bacterium]|jgi:UPF0716 protein FxsA|nr:FxsA family protein [Planctomycetota bacterium]